MSPCDGPHLTQHSITPRQTHLLLLGLFLQRLQLIEPLPDGEMSPVDRLDCLPVEEAERQRVGGAQSPLGGRGEQPAAHTQAGRGGRAVVLDVQRVRLLVRT